MGFVFHCYSNFATRLAALRNCIDEFGGDFGGLCYETRGIVYVLNKLNVTNRVRI